jgi:hypothetical protein
MQAFLEVAGSEGSNRHLAAQVEVAISTYGKGGAAGNGFTVDNVRHFEHMREGLASPGTAGWCRDSWR